MSKKSNAPTTTAAVATVIPCVFAKSANVAEAIINKAELPAETVIILSDADTEAYKKMAAHEGPVYSTGLLDQRLGKGQFKVSLFPRTTAKASNLGNTKFAQMRAKAAKNEEWEVLRDPKTPAEVIEANLGDPVQVIGCELNKVNKENLDAIHEILNLALAQAVNRATSDEERELGATSIEAYDALRHMLGIA